MAKSLIIVESPAKVRTISKFLGNDFTVKASMGHIRDLREDELSVDIRNDFKPEYVLIKDKKDIVKEIKEAATKVDKIFLATDPDREGEAICWHLAHELRSVKKPIKRITFNEITKTAVKNALENPGEINQRLVDAQQARRVLDRLVGYQISPILGKTIKWGLSAGRVQSVALRLVCEREDEIRSFVPEEYWTISAVLKGDNSEPFEAKLVQIDKEKVEIRNEEQALKILAELRDKDFIVDKIERKERKKNPVPPFITSKLQQEAARKLKFPVNLTMRVAQELYEGIDVGDEGSVGLITYMRTDSTRVAKEAIDDVRKFILDNYGPDYLPDKEVQYQNKKEAQDAHEAIRPTFVYRTPSEIKKYLTREQYELYDLIWKRFVASQMKPAIFDVTTVDIKAGNYTFRATGSVMKFKGFISVYLEGTDDDSEEDKENALPELKEGQLLQLINIIPEQHFTQPPPRYTESTLVKALEENGIGRPSTYATIISTIQERGYVVKEQGKFVPTEIGQLVNKVLLKSFPEIMDIEFTAKMEEELDDIEEGNREWVEVLREFYGPFSKSLKLAPKNIIEAKKDMEELTDEICELCGSQMVIKWGKYGRFLSCSAYPECKNMKPLNHERTSKDQVEITDEVCDKCGSPMVIKNSRYGKFLSCSQYPNCKHTKPLTTGIKCPKLGCEGYLVERKSKQGRKFYGCSKYPDCDFAIWDRLIARQCPNCGAPFLVEKNTKGKDTYIACISCNYKEQDEN